MTATTQEPRQNLLGLSPLGHTNNTRHWSSQRIVDAKPTMLADLRVGDGVLVLGTHHGIGKAGVITRIGTMDATVRTGEGEELVTYQMALLNPVVKAGDHIMSLTASSSDLQVVTEATEFIVRYQMFNGVDWSGGFTTTDWVLNPQKPAQEAQSATPVSESKEPEIASESIGSGSEERHYIPKAAYDALVKRAEEAERDLVNLWGALGEEADARGWCSEYDDFAEQNGGPSRTREWEVTVRMTTEITSSELDDAIGPLLNREGREVDVRSTVQVEHVADVCLNLQATEDQIVDGDMDSEVEEMLREIGWDFLHFEVKSARTV